MNIQTLVAQLGNTYNDYDGRYYTTTGYDDSAAAAAFLVVVLFFTLLIGVIAYVAMAFLLSRIFKKAGVESWKAWVPFYNNWILLQLGGQQGFWAVLAVIPIIGIASLVFMYIAMYNIGLKLGKGGEFVLWAIFIPIVWYIWLAVDDSKWKGGKVTGEGKPLHKKEA
jgi:hypothetical protein